MIFSNTSSKCGQRGETSTEGMKTPKTSMGLNKNALKSCNKCLYWHRVTISNVQSENIQNECILPSN